MDSVFTEETKGKQDWSSVPPPEPIKLYMPLTFELYPNPDWDGPDEKEEALVDKERFPHEGKILEAIRNNQKLEESERGAMHWYDKEDSVQEKVKSAFFTVEERDGQLWGVADCQVRGELSPEELETLKDYISGQASDGWGKSFEQREIKVDNAVLFIHFWNSDNWSIMTEVERFSPKYAEGLPEMCFSTLRNTGDLICIKRGETGYYPSDWDTGDKMRNAELANDMNEQLGVTMQQRKAMEAGSMFGWNVPGADPAWYEGQQAPQMGGMELG